MKQSFWTDKDFDVFYIEGLENRMTALQNIVQPKFFQLGDYFSNVLSGHGTGEFYPHVAKHARRTVNPPTDSWVAFAPAKRGYKALPHFQIGLWGTHLFIVIAVIYENPNKKTIAERFKNDLSALTSLNNDFIISGDHMKPDAELISEIGDEGVLKVLDRLYDVKKARSEEHTSELQSRGHLVCRLLLEKKKYIKVNNFKILNAISLTNTITISFLFLQ